MTPERIARLRQVLDRRQPDLTVVTDFVHKQRNLSALVRNCDAVGVLRMHAVIGDEDEVARRLRAYRNAGLTDFLAAPFTVAGATWESTAEKLAGIEI